MRTPLVIVVAFVLGCGPSAKPDPVGPITQTREDPTCPVQVPGTSVTVEDTDTGAALVFVTTGDAAAVRTRARALADAHNAHHAQMAPPAPAEAAPDPHAGHGGGGSAADPHAGHGAAGQTSTMGTMISTHSTAAMTELPTGARVTFTAHDPAAIQSELRMHAQHLAGGSCVM